MSLAKGSVAVDSRDDRVADQIPASRFRTPAGRTRWMEERSPARGRCGWGASQRRTFTKLDDNLAWGSPRFTVSFSHKPPPTGYYPFGLGGW